MLSTDFPYFHKDCPISVTTHNGTCIGVDFRDVFLVHLLPRDGHSRKTPNCQGTADLSPKNFANKKPVPLTLHAKINIKKSSKMTEDE